uniref:Uncharacterized protein n=1 Tax=Ciona savignyi TaxID=51511 RepID=H2YCV7_CIOSA
MAHRDQNSPGPSRNLAHPNRIRGLGADNLDIPMDLPILDFVENDEEFQMQGVNRRQRGRAGAVVLHPPLRANYRSRREQGGYFDSPNLNNEHPNEMIRGPPSRDGFSSDSFAGEEHDWSDGMSSISDFHDPIPPPYPPQEVGESSGLNGSRLQGGGRNIIFSRGAKRTRTGSTSSYSSVESVCFNSRKQKLANTNTVQCTSQRVALIDKLQKCRTNNEFTDLVLSVEDQEI